MAENLKWAWHLYSAGQGLSGLNTVGRFFLLKLKMPHPLLTVSQSDSLIQIVDINSHTEWQKVLIWIYTACKGSVYPDSTGQRLTLIVCIEVLLPSKLNGVMLSVVSLPNRSK